MSLGVSVILSVCLAGAALAADFNYSDFRDPSGLTLVGSTGVQGRVLRLTGTAGDERGAAWYTLEKNHVHGGFDTVFTFRMFNNADDGADGLAFLVQNDSADALGSGGSGMGYGDNGQGGIAQSLAVEFDTFGFDPESSNHISIQSDGANENRWEDEFSLGIVESPVDLNDEAEHTARVQYAGGVMNVYIDDLATPVLTAAIDLMNVRGDNILDKGGNAWVGFTSATGADFLADNHDVVNWSFAEGAPCEDCGTVSASCRRGKITVKVKQAPTGCLTTAVLDGGSAQIGRTNDRGKAKLTFKGVANGEHDVQIPACGFSTTVTCE
ncbi:MAG: hypothetical protein FLDDKLPJ_00130 [Phycisphaerae bacterium]|nr:hypothetical protein [Phycisphaerae bacterium]